MATPGVCFFYNILLICKRGGRGGIPAGLSRLEDTDIQRYRDTRPTRWGGEGGRGGAGDGPLADIQVYRYTDTQIIQIYGYTDIQIYRYAAIQIYRYTEIRASVRWGGGRAARTGQCGIYGDTEIRRYATRYVGGKGGGGVDPFSDFGE